MATANKVFVREDYFYCSICLEIFNTPRTLPCLHTFCHSCLEGYIQKILDKPGKQKLFCPVYRADTKTDNLQFKHVEKWVENLPINFTLLSILNERNSTMNPKENNCDPCLREEIKVKAIVYCYDCSEKLCEECKRHHKKSKLSSNHKLIDASEVCGDFDLTELDYFANLSKCPKHGSAYVKYLCKDHDQLCCSECAIVTHRKCEELVSLADEVNGNEEENGESDIQKRLEVVGDHTYKLIDYEKKFISDLNAKETEVKSCLKDFKANLDDAYNKLEKRILSEMSTRKLALTKASSLQKESAERLKDDIRQSVEKMKKASELGTARHIFLLEREMAKDIKVFEETFTGLQLQTSKSLLTIAETSPLQEAVKTVHDLFKVEEMITESLPFLMARARDFKDRKMTLMKEFDLQTQPRYCLWMENSIVVAFYCSETIFAYNSEYGSVFSFIIFQMFFFTVEFSIFRKR
ncbi:tripartite motif-containing protein 45-like [Mercenaria mercenaria]|uniref:tripartite motif-containing protein 45-like n=1 Tax=Mercenaria mercenaria TaxID=6596 RepID=UPI00234F9CE1|nr:tripartite motif-containing protein 45-like [Mercenaria mercenaria]